jgi:hypothetical protein
MRWHPLNRPTPTCIWMGVGFLMPLSSSLRLQVSQWQGSSRVTGAHQLTHAKDWASYQASLRLHT